MNYRGAIFDMDGLLFDTERIYQKTWREIAGERQVELGDDFVKAISGTAGARTLAVVEQYYQVADGSAILADCQERVRRQLEHEVPLKTGVFQILQYFRDEGVLLAVASSTIREQVEANLRTAGIFSFFDEIVSGQEVENGKPFPDIFLRAAEKIGCSPKECCVFEDSENGIRAAHAAGCDAIMIPDLMPPVPELRPYCTGIYPDLLEAMHAISG